MKNRTRITGARLACRFAVALSVASVVPVSPSLGQTGSVRTVSGSGSGAYIVSNGQRTDVAAAALPAGGGQAAAELADVNVPGMLASRNATAVTAGEGATDLASTQTVATAADVRVLNGRITASRVVSVASVVAAKNKLVSDGDGSSFTNLVVDGVAMGGGGEYTPAPNTRVELPGVGYAVLNEQAVDARGARGAAITVNMIHVVLQDASGTQTGDIVVGSATSSVGS